MMKLSLPSEIIIALILGLSKSGISKKLMEKISEKSLIILLLEIKKQKRNTLAKWNKIIRRTLFLKNKLIIRKKRAI